MQHVRRKTLPVGLAEEWAAGTSPAMTILVASVAKLGDG
jgi:hypothetical protein